MTNETMQDLSKKQLFDEARRLGIATTPTLKKEELVSLIVKAKKKSPRPSAPQPTPTPSAARKTSADQRKPSAARPSRPVAKSPPAKPVVPSRNGPAKPSASRAKAKSAARDTSDTSSAEPQISRAKFDTGAAHPSRDLSMRHSKDLPLGYTKDRINLMVKDPYWLHVYWELTHQSVQRAEAALGQDWYGAKPILRLLDVTSQDTTSTSEAIVRDVDIHGGCNNWYLEVSQPPKTYRVDIGYLSKRGHFFVLSRSNNVTMPKAGVSDTIDETWTDLDARQADRILSMSGGNDPTSASGNQIKQLFEERLRRPMSSSATATFGSHTVGGNAQSQKFFFEIDAELIVFGRTDPRAQVSLQGETVKLRPDGTFTMRYSLPDSRQIIPAVAASADGIEERTIVLAVERNTKILEPMIHDANGDN